jgi:drug/metabolite transporter (DMT)-like permease
MSQHLIISMQNNTMKRIYLIISATVVLLTVAAPAYAAGVPDADSMMTVAFVAGLILLILVINAVFGAWVYKDAKQRGMKNPVGWIVAVVITGVPALIGYMMVRPKGNSETVDE